MKFLFFISIVLIQFVRLNAQTEFIFQIDTIEKWQKHNYFYVDFLNDQNLLLSDWKNLKPALVDKEFSHVPSFYLDTFLPKNGRQANHRGVLCSDEAGGFFRLYNGKIFYFNGETRKEKLIFRLPKKYKGVKYKRYESFYNPIEGQSIQYNKQHNTIFFQVHPNVPFNRSGDFCKKYSNAKLIFEVDKKGKLIKGYGGYDSMYLQSLKKEIDVCYYQYVDTLEEIIITQKASSCLQLRDLNNISDRTIQLNTNKIEGRFTNYDSLSQDKSIEHKMKILIESPSFGAVTYSSNLQMYLVLRTDSIFDSTWTAIPNIDFFKKQEFKKQTGGKYCPVWSNQFWKQMALYRNKPVFIQLYDKNFQFVKEIETPFPNRIQFLTEQQSEILLYCPNTSQLIYHIRFK